MVQYNRVQVDLALVVEDKLDQVFSERVLNTLDPILLFPLRAVLSIRRELEVVDGGRREDHQVHARAAVVPVNQLAKSLAFEECIRLLVLANHSGGVLPHEFHSHAPVIQLALQAQNFLGVNTHQLVAAHTLPGIQSVSLQDQLSVEDEAPLIEIVGIDHSQLVLRVMRTYDLVFKHLLRCFLAPLLRRHRLPLRIQLA